MKHSDIKRLLAPIFLVAVVFITGCNEDRIERTLGGQTSAMVEKEFGVNNDPILQDWLNTMGHSLVGQSHRQHITYSFKVLETDMVNAFAVPYGYVYVTRGMLNFAETEDEVAFVVGHEVAHIVHRDSIKAVKKGVLFDIASVLIGQRSRGAGDLVGLGSGLMMLHYSRDDERAADTAGSRFAYGAGYDPQASVVFFTKLRDEYGQGRVSSLTHLLLTHPPADSRIALQKTRPEHDLSDPAVASRIGRSYARRHAFNTAINYYQAALEKKPEARETRLALAEAFTGVGRYDLAGKEYNALAAVPGYSEIKPEPAQPVMLTALSAAEQQEAREQLTTVAGVREQSKSLASTAGKFDKDGKAQIAPATKIAQQAVSSMLEFASMDVKLSERAQETFLVANGAIRLANEAAYSLENIQVDIKKAAVLLERTAGQVNTGMNMAAEGRGAAGDVAAYMTALGEIDKANRELSQAMAEAQSTISVVNSASAAGERTVAAVDQMLRDRDPDRNIYSVRTHAENAQKLAETALQAVRKSKQIADIAESRAVLARLNVVAVGAGPQMRHAFDGMVAHTCGFLPEEAAQLRMTGHGYGDVGFILMAARASRSAPDRVAAVAAERDIIDEMNNAGISLFGPTVLLRYLVNAMEREMAAAQS